MDKIIKEIKVELNKNDEPIVRGRILHKALKIKTEYKIWINRMLEYGFIENEDFKRVYQKCNTLGGEQTIVDHILTFDMAKEISMIQKNEQGKKYRKYFIQKEKELLAIVKQRKLPEWTNSRKESKSIRTAETDTIKLLVEYAKDQGSNNSDKLYMLYSKLANQTIGIFNRDIATVRQLNNLTIVENIIENVIKIGIQENKYYKDIYQDCKKRLQQFKEIAFLP